MFLDGFQGQPSSGLETSDRRNLPGLLPQLECATPAPYKMDSLLTEGLVQYAGLTEEVSVQSQIRPAKISMAKVPNPALREAIMEIVHNQVRDGTPPETRFTLDRLLAAGHTRERAEELIACVVSSEIFDVLQEGQEYNESRFVAALRRLPKLPWDEA